MCCFWYSALVLPWYVPTPDKAQHCCSTCLQRPCQDSKTATEFEETTKPTLQARLLTQWAVYDMRVSPPYKAKQNCSVPVLGLPFLAQDDRLQNKDTDWEGRQEH